MSLKHLIIASTAAITLALPGTLFAQSVEYRNAAADARAPSDSSADAHKDRKVEEATAADAKFQANRTEANRVARDKAESDAAVAVDKANAVDPNKRR